MKTSSTVQKLAPFLIFATGGGLLQLFTSLRLHSLEDDAGASSDLLVAPSITTNNGNGPFHLFDNLTEYYGAHFPTTSHLHWATLQDAAENVTENSFCLSWQVNCDLWWTHHPDWEILKEHIGGYCFQIIPDKELRESLLDLYHHQFFGNCKNVLTPATWSAGWNADLGQLESTLWGAYKVEGIQWQISTKPWHYAAPDHTGRERLDGKPQKTACDLMNFYCYFLKAGSCKMQSKETKRLDRKHRLDSTPIKPNREVTRRYLVRPQTWMRLKVFELMQKQNIAMPCTTIHVRRGDVIVLKRQARKYHSMAEYLNATSDIESNILLLTDDQNAIGEAKSLHPKYNWMFLNRPRYQGASGGFERHLPSGDPSFEMTVLLATFQLVQKCSSLIHSASGFSSVLSWYMHKAQPSSKAYNLDAGLSRKQTHQFANYDSISLSQKFETRQEKD